MKTSDEKKFNADYFPKVCDNNNIKEFNILTMSVLESELENQNSPSK
jgi:hypothetical protein